MTLRRDPESRIYSADIKGGAAGRLHVSLKTTVKGEAMRRHAAVEALVREAAAYPDLLDRLRRRKLTVQDITATFEAKRPFDALRQTVQWPTLGEAAEQYLAWLKDHPTRASRTWEQAQKPIRTARERFGDATRLDEITTEQMETYHRALKAQYMPGTVNQYLIRLQALYSWAGAREARRAMQEKRVARVLHCPITRELLPAVEPTRVRFLSPAEATRLLEATPEALQFPIAAGLFAGLRLGEILALRPPPRDIDLETGQILIQARDGSHPWRPKTRKNREVPIAESLQPIIERHVERYASDVWMLPSTVQPEAPASDVWLQRGFERVATDAGLLYSRSDTMGVTFHTLRHTFASWLVMEGVDLFTVAKLLGHSSTKMVERVYGHLAPEHRRWAVNRLGNRLATSTGAGNGTAEDTENAE